MIEELKKTSYYYYNKLSKNLLLFIFAGPWGIVGATPFIGYWKFFPFNGGISFCSRMRKQKSHLWVSRKENNVKWQVETRQRRRTSMDVLFCILDGISDWYYCKLTFIIFQTLALKYACFAYKSTPPLTFTRNVSI